MTIRRHALSISKVVNRVGLTTLVIERAYPFFLCLLCYFFLSVFHN